MEKPKDYKKNTDETLSGTKIIIMRDPEVCNEDIIPSVQTSDPLEAFLVPTAPT